MGFFSSLRESLFPKEQPTVTPLSGFKSHLECYEYLEREVSAQKGFFVTGTRERPSLRWHYGPLWFERYTGDVEPTIEKKTPFRLFMWQPIFYTEKAKGWGYSFFAEAKSMSGFAKIPHEGNYWDTWSSHAKRHRKNWLKEQPEWEVLDMDIHDFSDAYHYSKIDPILKFAFLGLLKTKFKAHGKNLRMMGFRRKGQKKVEAGFTYLHIPECKQSLHTISFILPSARETSVGTGMIDYWFAECQKRGIEVADFGVFWTPGEPTSWKGFSKFKAQFCTGFVKYPKVLVKWEGSWKQNIYHFFGLNKA